MRPRRIPQPRLLTILIRHLVRLTRRNLQPALLRHNMLHAVRVRPADLPLAVVRVVIGAAAAQLHAVVHVAALAALLAAAAQAHGSPFAPIPRDDGLDHGNVADNHGDKGLAAGPDGDNEAVGLRVCKGVDAAEGGGDHDEEAGGEHADEDDFAAHWHLDLEEELERETLVLWWFFRKEAGTYRHGDGHDHDISGQIEGKTDDIVKVVLDPAFLCSTMLLVSCSKLKEEIMEKRLTARIRNNLPLLVIWPTRQVQCQHHNHICQSRCCKRILDQRSSLKTNTKHHQRLAPQCHHILRGRKNSRNPPEEKDHAQLQRPHRPTVRVPSQQKGLATIGTAPELVVGESQSLFLS